MSDQTIRPHSAMPETLGAPAPPPPVPYRGIESFRFVDQSIFFARDEESEHLLRYVAVYRGVLLYGDSGAGKSSLVNAGLIPAILREGFVPNRLRVQPRPGEEIIVERISTSADGSPPYLPSIFADEENTAARLVLSIDAFRERVRSRAQTERPLLIFDQFEEFVTLFEEAPQGEAIREARKAQEGIIELIVELLRDQTLPVKLLFVFREDYLAKLSKLFARAPELQKQYQRITPLAIDNLYAIIRGSFERFPGYFDREIPPELARDLASAIEARSESGVVNLSEVQIACLRLWQSSNPVTLFREQGVTGLLEGYLSDSIGKLSADLRDPAIALLSRLVTAGGTRNVISEEDLLSLVRNDQRFDQRFRKDPTEAALRALEHDTKLIRRELRRDTIFYEIVSEFLVSWIQRQKVERASRVRRRKIFRWIALALLVIFAGETFLLYELDRRNDSIEQQEDQIREQNDSLRQQHQQIALQRSETYVKVLKDSTVAQWRVERQRDSVEEEMFVDSISQLKREVSVARDSMAMLKREFTTLKKNYDNLRISQPDSETLKHLQEAVNLYQKDRQLQGNVRQSLRTFLSSRKTLQAPADSAK